MAAENYSSDETIEFIQNLPPELQEKIYKEYITTMIKQRLNLGFDLVNFIIELAPFCEENQQITKITACSKCRRCEKNNLCYLCFKNRKKHRLGFNFSNLKGDELEHTKFEFLKYV